MPQYISPVRWTTQGRAGLPAWREIVTKLGRRGGEETERLRAFTRAAAEEIVKRL
ncbi:MAG: hypothetical protein ACYDCH_09185 [Gaiellaceae bacterium]